MLLKQHKSDVALTASNEIVCNTLNLCFPYGKRAVFIPFFKKKSLTRAVNLLALSLFYTLNFFKHIFTEVIICLIHPALSVPCVLYALKGFLSGRLGVAPSMKAKDRSERRARKRDFFFLLI